MVHRHHRILNRNILVFLVVVVVGVGVVGVFMALGDDSTMTTFFSSTLVMVLVLGSSSKLLSFWWRFLWMASKGTSFQVELQTGHTRLPCLRT